MRALIQRVSQAEVKVEGNVTGKIQTGLLIFAGFTHEDTKEDLEWVASKISGMRIFPDQHGHMNLSLMDIDAGILLVSQFTLYASCKKGNRPGFTNAAKPEIAKDMYLNLSSILEKLTGKKTELGIFGADMKVNLLNDGPVTIMLDSKNKDLF